MSPANSSSFSRQDGFSLLEVTIAGSIGSLIMAGVLTSYILCARSFYAINNYWEIHTEGRHAIERFGMDARMASDVTAFATNGPITLRIPTSFAANGTVLNSKLVTYTYVNNQLQRTDSVGNVTDILARNIYRVNFRMYDRLGNVTTARSVAKGIQLELFLRKFTAGRAQTEDYLAARLNMRNKP